jgi:hypothetical protein
MTKYPTGSAQGDKRRKRVGENEARRPIVAKNPWSTEPQPMSGEAVGRLGHKRFERLLFGLLVHFLLLFF